MKCKECGEMLDKCPDCGRKSCPRCQPDACPRCNRWKNFVTKRFN